MIEILTSAICIGNAESNSDEWHRLRMSGIGGSDVAKILGLSPWGGPIEVWNYKKYGAKKKELTEPQEWGIRLEPVVLEKFQEIMPNLNIITTNNMYRHPVNRFLLANPDALILDKNNIISGVEIKTADKYSGEKFIDGIPNDYMLQIQLYMHVFDVKDWFIAYLIGGNNFNYQLIKRDDELLNIIIPKLSDFWDHVESGLIPEPTFADEKAINNIFEPAFDEQAIYIDTDLTSDYKRYTVDIKEMAQKRKEVINSIKLSLAGNVSGYNEEYIITNKKRLVIKPKD